MEDNQEDSGVEPRVSVPAHSEAHVHHEVRTHHPSHTPTSQSQMPWMMVSILLAVLLLASLYMNYSLVKSVINRPEATVPAAPTPSAPTPSQPSAPQPTPSADITLAADDHVRGDRNAKVIIVEYSDFQCPFCGRAQPTIEQVRTTYGKDIALVFRHFPLGFHENARSAAIASECASEQGKFWEYHDVLFANQQALAQANLIKYATDLKLDVDKFTTCLKTEKYGSKVDASEQAGQGYGVQGTPAFFINGNLLSGAQPFAAFKQAIDAELA